MPNEQENQDQEGTGAKLHWLDGVMLLLAALMLTYLIIQMWKPGPQAVDFAKFLTTVAVGFGFVAAGWILIRISESHKGDVSLPELFGSGMIAFGALYCACAICPGYVQSIIKHTSFINQQETDPPELLVSPVTTGTPPTTTGKELNFEPPATQPDKIVIQIEVPGDTTKLVIPPTRGKAWYRFKADSTTGAPARDSLYTAF